MTDGAAKFFRKRLRIPITHSEPGIHRKERISAENLLAIVKGFRMKNQKMTKKIEDTFGLFSDTLFNCHQGERRVQLTFQEKNHSFFRGFIIMNETLPRRNLRWGEVHWRKLKNLRQKTWSIISILQENHARKSVVCYCLAHDFVPMKTS